MSLRRPIVSAALLLVLGSNLTISPAAADGSCSSSTTTASSTSHSKKAARSAAATGNIVHVAANAGTFQTLLAAAKAAGLVEALSGEGPLTVFAPTDDAFAKLPKGTVEGLLEPQNRAKLARILKFHVVAGLVTSDKLGSIAALRTLEGSPLTVDLSSGVRVQKANVIKADIAASNGVIHVIDSVLLPETSATAIRN